MSAYGMLSTESIGIERRRRALQSLIARYDQSPNERERLLAEITKEQRRLNIYKRGSLEKDDVLAWVDTWKPRRPRQGVFQSIRAAF